PPPGPRAGDTAVDGAPARKQARARRLPIPLPGRVQGTRRRACPHSRRSGPELAPDARTFSVTPLDARGGAEHIDGNLRALSGAESAPHSLPGRGSGPVSQGHSPPIHLVSREGSPHE